jgi:hypothetical protein
MEGTRNAQANTVAAQSSCAPASKGGWLNSRNVLIGAALLGGAALFFGWTWLVAAGLASVILGVLPCLAMCALGLCMRRMGKKGAAAPASAPLSPQDAQVGSSAARKIAGN